MVEITDENIFYFNNNDNGNAVTHCILIVTTATYLSFCQLYQLTL